MNAPASLRPRMLRKEYCRGFLLIVASDSDTGELFYSLF
jgi:hypothetical protein